MWSTHICVRYPKMLIFWLVWLVHVFFGVCVSFLISSHLSGQCFVTLFQVGFFNALYGLKIKVQRKCVKEH